MDSPASEREEDMELRLDELGRIAGTSQCGLDFSTRTASAQLTTAPTPDNPTVNVNGRAVGEGEGEGEETRPHESFPPHSLSRNEPNEDTQAALLASLRRDCRRVFCSESFWLGAGEEPRCGLEALARDVFALHTREVAFDADRSGAEWWVQVCIAWRLGVDIGSCSAARDGGMGRGRRRGRGLLNACSEREE